MDNDLDEQLPTGFNLVNKPKSDLPDGFKLKAETTPQQRDEAKLTKEAGVFAAEEKTPEEIKKMTLQEKRDYIEALNTEKEYLRSSQFVKGVLSGATFGATENIEALKPIEFEESNPYWYSDVSGKIVGSLVPLSKLAKIISGPATTLAAKSPVLQKQISSLLTMFGVGTVDKTLHSLAKGEIPSAEEVVEHGAEWAAIDLGLQGLGGAAKGIGAAGKFVSGLISRSNVTGLPKKEIVNNIANEIKKAGIELTQSEKVAETALELLQRPIEEAEIQAGKQAKLIAEDQIKNEIKAVKEEIITPKQLKNKKISEAPINSLLKEKQVLSEPYQPNFINLTSEAEALENTVIRNRIESVGERAVSEEVLGDSIKENLESQLESQKSEYRPLYTQAEEAAELIHHIPTNTAREAGQRLVRISRLRTRPEGYPNVITKLENVLEDAGFTVQRNQSGVIEQIIQNNEVPVSDLIELGKRLNEIIDFEAVEPTVKDALRGVVRAVKQDIRIGLEAAPDALAAFELAEEAHANVARRFSPLTKLRKIEAGEKIAKMAESPSVLSDLQQTLSAQQMLQVEREMLEKISTQSHEKAEKTLREVGRHLSENNRNLAREIVEAKNPHNPSLRRNIIREGILEDVSNAFTTGQRPAKTLNLWKTSKGQRIVRESFRGSPNWPGVKNYLEQQSFNDMFSSVLEKGRINPSKLNDFMSDPAIINDIRSQGGEEAVLFFKDLTKKIKQIEKNSSILQKKLPEDLFTKVKDKTEWRDSEAGRAILKRMKSKDYPAISKFESWKDWMKETLGLKTQAAMTVFGAAKLGAGAAATASVLGIPGTVVGMVGYRVMNKLLTSSSFRKAFKQAAKHHIDPLKFILAWEQLGEELD